MTAINVSPPTIAHAEVIQALTTIRNQWEEAAQGNSLTQISGNVGLFDVTVALGLQGEDLTAALGDLADEAVKILVQ